MLNYVRQFFKIRVVFHTLYLWNEVGDPQQMSLNWLTGKLRKSNRNDKMAGSSGESDGILIQSLKEHAMNKSTLQSTNNWVKVWKSWAAQKGYDESFKK